MRSRLGRCRRGSSASLGVGRHLGARRKLQLFQPGDQSRVLAFALGVFRLDGLENRAQAVEQLQQAGDDRPVGGQLALAQLAQQVFSGVGQLFQPLEAQKPGGSLDRMHRAEDLSDQARILRTLFQVGQTALHAVQPLLALDQEFSRQFIHCVHSSAQPE